MRASTAVSAPLVRSRSDDLCIALETMHALPAHIAVLDARGLIVATNRAWDAFAVANAGRTDGLGVGANYLAVCDAAAKTGDPTPLAVASAIRRALRGEDGVFEAIYPCHAPWERRWFRAYVTSFLQDGRRLALVSHDDVSALKFSELQAERARQELEHLAHLDALTHLPNRRALEAALAHAWAACARERAPLAVLMADIDGFKPYNDTRGHLAGDRALQVVAEAFATTLIRPRDVAARYGGDEFVAVLPHTDGAGAAHVAERLRLRVAGLTLEWLGVALRASVGVASTADGAASSVQALLACADRALYAAKHGGRDRVVVWHPGLAGAHDGPGPYGASQGAGRVVPRPRIELGTLRFSVLDGRVVGGRCGSL